MCFSLLPPIKTHRFIGFLSTPALTDDRRRSGPATTQRKREAESDSGRRPAERSLSHACHLRGRSNGRCRRTRRRRRMRRRCSFGRRAAIVWLFSRLRSAQARVVRTAGTHQSYSGSRSRRRSGRRLFFDVFCSTLFCFGGAVVADLAWLFPEALSPFLLGSSPCRPQ